MENFLEDYFWKGDLLSSMRQSNLTLLKNWTVKMKNVKDLNKDQNDIYGNQIQI